MPIALPKLPEICPKRTNEERRRDVTERTLEAAIQLFREQGYQKTTTRQIAQRAGVLNGSLYNVFSSKEAIFERIILNAYDTVIEEAGSLIRKGDGLAVTVAFPLALDLFSVSRDPRTAELMDEAHRSWRITKGFVDRTERWVSRYLDAICPGMSSETVRTNLLALVGVVGNFVSRYRYEGGTGYTEELRVCLELFCTLFRIPAFDIDASLERVAEIFDSEEIVINGIRI